MANEADDRVKIDVQAEKTAFSEKLTLKDPHREMVKPTDPFKSEPHKFEFIKNDNTNPVKFESNFMGVKGETTKLESSVMNFNSAVSSPSMSAGNPLSIQDSFKISDTSRPSPLSAELMNASLKQSNQGIDFSSINKQIDKVFSSKVTPALQNMAQYAQQLSNINTDHKNVHDELPTIPPSNLVFNDRIQSAMQTPDWA